MGPKELIEAISLAPRSCFIPFTWKSSRFGHNLVCINTKMDEFEEFADVAPQPARTPVRQESVQSLASVTVRESAPAPSFSSSDRAKAGLAVVAVATGTAIGAVLGGPSGAVMGLAGVGALRNLYRAQHLGADDPSLRGDAARSAALCVVGFGVVGYLAYRLLKKDD